MGEAPRVGRRLAGDRRPSRSAPWPLRGGGATGRLVHGQGGRGMRARVRLRGHRSHGPAIHHRGRRGLRGLAPRLSGPFRAPPRVATSAMVMIVAGCSSGGPGMTPHTPAPSDSVFVVPSPPTSASAHEPEATVLAAGDIADCKWETDAATAALVAERDGTVLTVGDNVYPAGSDTTYADCYDPTWGAFFDRTRPSIGNHD